MLNKPRRTMCFAFYKNNKYIIAEGRDVVRQLECLLCKNVKKFSYPSADFNRGLLAHKTKTLPLSYTGLRKVFVWMAIEWVFAAVYLHPPSAPFGVAATMGLFVFNKTLYQNKHFPQNSLLSVVLSTEPTSPMNKCLYLHCFQQNLPPLGANAFICIAFNRTYLP